MRTSPLHATIVADVVGSRSIPDFPARRDELLESLSVAHGKHQRVLTRYTITAWDEFQTIVSQLSHLPDVIWDLRREFQPWRLKIGVGIGPLQTLPQLSQPVNEVAMGEAFVRSREAMKEIGATKQKYRVLTRLRGTVPILDDAVNLIYDLLDTLLLETTERQWATIKGYEATERLEATARRLKIDESTVSRNLQRGSYWQAVEARERLREIFGLYPRVQVSRLVPKSAR